MGYYPSKSNKKQNINLKNHVNAFKEVVRYYKRMRLVVVI